MGIAPTKDVLEEFNWGWYTRLPLGPARTMTENGMENSWRWEWGLEGDIPPAALFDDDFVRGTAVGNPEGGRTSRVMRRIARWNGKAPHTSLHRVRSMSNVVTSISKSLMWDADWWRVRLCGDPMRMPTRVPYGRVYEPGCMDGFWQGRMVVSLESSSYDDVLLLMLFVVRHRDSRNSRRFSGTRCGPMSSRRRAWQSCLISSS